MRKILFRGKRIDNGEWACSGNIIHFNEENEHYIPVVNSKCTCTHDANDNIIEWNEVMFCKVMPETVGQYTGLKDKNGKRIFEGDIFSHNNKYLYEVAWCDERKGFFAIATDLSDDDFVGNFYECNMEVIGNIHDNPELLEVEENA